MEFPQYQSVIGSTDNVDIVGSAVLPNGTPVQTNPTTISLPTGGSVEVSIVTKQNSDGSLSVTVQGGIITIDSLLGELDSNYALGAIKTTDVYSGLRDKLIAAKSLIQRGNKSAAIKQ